MRKQFLTIAGFTLAEVLITLTVVGVISALVIPSIIQRTQDAELKAAFKNNYSMLDQVTKRLVQDNGGSLAGVFANNDDFRNKYSPYLSYVKTCNDSDVVSSGSWPNLTILSNCWSKYNYNLNKNIEGTDDSSQDSQAVLNNGASLDFYLRSSGCTDGDLTAHNACGDIIIDVNGLKGPNQYGKDIFLIYVSKNNVVPWGSKTTVRFNGSCDSTSTEDDGWGFGCAYKVLMNQDY